MSIITIAVHLLAYEGKKTDSCDQILVNQPVVCVIMHVRVCVRVCVFVNLSE